MYKLAARSNCSFKIVQIARWLPDLIVPFFPLNVWGAPEKKCTFFQFLSTMHAKVANSSPTNYIFLRSAINTLSIEHIKSPFFQNLKIGLECLPLVLTHDLIRHYMCIRAQCTCYCACASLYKPNNNSVSSS